MDKYLILKGCAGLGNRFVTLMKAIQYAKLSGRKLCIDWCDGMFASVGENAFDKYFDLNYKNRVSLEEIKKAFEKGAATYPKHLTMQDFDSPIYPESKSEASFRVYTPKLARNTLYKVGLSLIPLHKLVYILGLQSFQRPQKMEGMDWWKMVRTMNDGNNLPLGSNLWPWLKADIVLFADFRPCISMRNFSKTIILKDSLQERVNDKAKLLNLNNAIGVHVRYTDKKPKGRLDALIRTLQAKLQGNDMNIFLCTDNKDIEEDFVCSFKERVIKTEKYIPKVKGEGIHIWVSQQSDDSLKTRMFEDCLMDMWLLSKCKLLYWQGNSSFSLISKLLLNDNSRCVNWLGLK